MFEKTQCTWVHEYFEAIFDKDIVRTGKLSPKSSHENQRQKRLANAYECLHPNAHD